MALTTITNPMVSINAIQGTLIADNAITAVHIATNAVSGTLVADNAITATHIAQNVITVTQLADDAVEAAKIADGVITTNHLNKAMISSQTEVSVATGDFILLGDTSDSNNLKKAPISSILAASPTGAGAFTSNVTITTADNTDTLELISTDTDANQGPILNLNRNPNEAGADNDYLGQIYWSGHNDAGTPEEIIYAKLTTQILDASDGTEDANMVAYVMKGGSRKDMLRLGPTEAVINEGSEDIDFRVESNGNADMLFVDGGNDNILLGTQNQGHIRLNQQLGLAVSGNVYGGMSFVTHSSNASGNRALLDFNRSRNTTIGSHTVVNSGDVLGTIVFRGDDGDEFLDACYIQGEVDGTPGDGDMPGRLTFYTTADGSDSSSERMRIDDSGNVGINVTNPGHKLEVSGDIEFSKAGDGNTAIMHVIDTADTEVALFEGRRAGDTGSWIAIRHNPSTPQETNRAGIKFQADDDGGNVTNYAQIGMYIDDHTDGAEDGNLQFHIMSNNSLEEKLRLDADQMIFKGDSGSSFIRVDNRGDGHDTGFEIYQNSSRKWELHSDDSNTDAFDIRNNAGTSRFTFTQDGDLGVGTTSPQTELHVYNTNNSAGNLFTAVGAGNVPSITVQNASTTNDVNAAIFFRDDADMRASIGCRYVSHASGDQKTQLRFSTCGSGNTRERMTLNEDGFLGIGTDDPKGGLHVAASGDGYLIVTGDGNPLKGGRIVGHDGGLTFQPNTGTNSTYSEAMRITTDKKIYIGTSGPALAGVLSVEAGNAGVPIIWAKNTDGDSVGIRSQVDGTASSNYIYAAYNGGGIKWKIRNDGDHQGTDTSIGSISDSRTKKDVANLTYDIAKFKQYRPITFNWINPDCHNHKSNNRGFLAQEIKAIDDFYCDKYEASGDDIPLVDEDGTAHGTKFGYKDAMYISVIQQLITRLETAEAKITALEG